MIGMKVKNNKLCICSFDPGSDSVEELTSLLNRSYKTLADMGFRYVASYQDANKTLERMKNAVCFVGKLEEKIIATISYYSPEHTSYPGWPEGVKVAHFGQFAVEPAYQKLGIGSRLLDHVEHYAFINNAAELALDTAENASHLVNYYTRKGYCFRTYVQWKETNYRSVILSKKLSIPH